MSVKWIRDVDSGELFPVPDEEPEFDIPEHLKTAEYNKVDYEKTERTAIEQLQEQLTAAQNEIEVYRNTKPVDISEEIQEPVQGRLADDVHKPRKEISRIDIMLIILVVAVVFTFALAVRFFAVNNPVVAEVSQEVYEAAENAEEKKSVIEIIFEYAQMFLPIVFSILGVRFATHLLLSSFEGRFKSNGL